MVALSSSDTDEHGDTGGSKRAALENFIVHHFDNGKHFSARANAYAYVGVSGKGSDTVVCRGSKKEGRESLLLQERVKKMS